MPLKWFFSTFYQLRGIKGILNNIKRTFEIIIYKLKGIFR
jgi:hypothetical protein